MPLPTSDVIDFLENLGWDTTQESGAPILQGPYVPPSPDKIVVVTPIPGPGYILESAVDVSAFQARVRGGQDDQAGAEALAFDLDARILAASFPAASASGKTIIHIHRQGGTPSPLANDPDDAERFDYVTNYLVFASA